MASIDMAAMTNLVTAVNTAITSLPSDRYGLTSALNPVDVDSSPANKLSGVAAWAESELPGLQRRLALAKSIDSQKPSLQGTVQLDESSISTLTPDQAIAQGKKDAQALAKSRSMPSAALLAEIAANSTDPYFSSGFAKNTTPAELAATVKGASRAGEQLLQNGGPNSAAYTAWQRQYSDLLAGCGTNIATATNNYTGTLALSDGYSKQWLDTITGTTMPDGSPEQPGTGAAAALLLRYGSFDPKFLDTVSSGVYDYERATNQDGMWSNRANNSGDGSYAGPLTPDGKGAFDPMASIMTALGHTPVAAQRFFDVDNPGATTVTMTFDGKTMQVDARLKYLIQDRTWANDDGAGIGLALQAATTYWRDSTGVGQSAQQRWASDLSSVNGDGQTSAVIASQALALIGDKTGDGQSDGSIFGIGSHDGWKMWGGMRTNVANIVASYSPDLIRMTQGGNPLARAVTGDWVVPFDAGDDLFPPDGPPSAWMDPDLMNRLLSTLGQDPANIDRVNAGIAASGSLMLSYGAQKGKADPKYGTNIITGGQIDPSIASATSAMAYAMNFVITAGYKGDSLNQKQQQAAAAHASQLLGLALSVPTLAVPEGHAWTGWAIDALKDQMLDKVGEGPDADAQGAYNEEATKAQSGLEQLTMSTLLSNGYFGADQYAAAQPPGDPNKFVSPFDVKYSSSPGNSSLPAVTVVNGKPHFNFSSPAYQDWLAQSGMSTWLGTYVDSPFKKDFPAFGTS
jgi:hypothetical protein